jgi:multisubunit Na+/H+ antiporter MnhB subunit
MILLNATEASWGLYQLVFVGGALLAMYSAYAWYEGRRDKSEDGIRRAKLLFLLATVTMVAVAVVSFAITHKLPF